MLKLKEIRENRGLTQTQVAKIINVDRSEISKYESGKRELNQDQIVELVKAFNTNADYFLALSGTEEKKERLSAFFFLQIFFLFFYFFIVIKCFSKKL